MYAPVFLPTAPNPSPEVLAAECDIVEAEGPYHVDGRYYACESDAAIQRRHTAERRVREADRRAEWAQRWTKRAAAFCAASDPSVTTWLTTRERTRIESDRDGRGKTVHRDTVSDVRGDLANGRADAALVSAVLTGPADVGGLAALVRGFPEFADCGGRERRRPVAGAGVRASPRERWRSGAD